MRGKRGHVPYFELDQFVGPRYLVTVHGPINPAAEPDVALRETSEVLARIETGRLHPATSYELACAIVSAMTRHHEVYVESATNEVWKLEQQVTGWGIEDPEAFLNELFRTRHGLLAVRTMGVISGVTRRRGEP